MYHTSWFLTQCRKITQIENHFDKLLVTIHKCLDKNQPVFLNITAADPGKGKSGSAKAVV
jgi:hypothetical protein